MINFINEIIYYIIMIFKEFEMIVGIVVMFLKNVIVIKYIEWLLEIEYSCGNDFIIGEDVYIIILFDLNECFLEE